MKKANTNPDFVRWLSSLTPDRKKFNFNKVYKVLRRVDREDRFRHCVKQLAIDWHVPVTRLTPEELRRHRREGSQAEIITPATGDPIEEGWEVLDECNEDSEIQTDDTSQEHDLVKESSDNETLLVSSLKYEPLHCGVNKDKGLQGNTDLNDLKNVSLNNRNTQENNVDSTNCEKRPTELDYSLQNNILNSSSVDKVLENKLDCGLLNNEISDDATNNEINVDSNISHDRINSKDSNENLFEFTSGENSRVSVVSSVVGDKNTKEIFLERELLNCSNSNYDFTDEAMVKHRSILSNPLNNDYSSQMSTNLCMLSEVQTSGEALCKSNDSSSQSSKNDIFLEGNLEEETVSPEESSSSDDNDFESEARRLQEVLKLSEEDVMPAETQVKTTSTKTIQLIKLNKEYEVLGGTDESSGSSAIRERNCLSLETHIPECSDINELDKDLTEEYSNSKHVYTTLNDSNQKLNNNEVTSIGIKVDKTVKTSQTTNFAASKELNLISCKQSLPGCEPHFDVVNTNDKTNSPDEMETANNEGKNVTKENVVLNVPSHEHFFNLKEKPEKSPQERKTIEAGLKGLAKQFRDSEFNEKTWANNKIGNTSVVSKTSFMEENNNKTTETDSEVDIKLTYQEKQLIQCWWTCYQRSFTIMNIRSSSFNSRGILDYEEETWPENPTETKEVPEEQNIDSLLSQMEELEREKNMISMLQVNSSESELEGSDGISDDESLSATETNIPSLLTLASNVLTSILTEPHISIPLLKNIMMHGSANVANSAKQPPLPSYPPPKTPPPPPLPTLTLNCLSEIPLPPSETDVIRSDNSMPENFESLKLLENREPPRSRPMCLSESSSYTESSQNFCSESLQNCPARSSSVHEFKTRNSISDDETSPQILKKASLVKNKEKVVFQIVHSQKKQKLEKSLLFDESSSEAETSLDVTSPTNLLTSQESAPLKYTESFASSPFGKRVPLLTTSSATDAGSQSLMTLSSQHLTEESAELTGEKELSFIDESTEEDKDVLPAVTEESSQSLRTSAPKSSMEGRVGILTREEKLLVINKPTLEDKDDLSAATEAASPALTTSGPQYSKEGSGGVLKQENKPLIINESTQGYEYSLSAATGVPPQSLILPPQSSTEGSVGAITQDKKSLVINKSTLKDEDDLSASTGYLSSQSLTTSPPQNSTEGSVGILQRENNSLEINKSTPEEDGLSATTVAASQSLTTSPPQNSKEGSAGVLKLENKSLFINKSTQEDENCLLTKNNNCTLCRNSIKEKNIYVIKCWKVSRDRYVTTKFKSRKPRRNNLYKRKAYHFKKKAKRTLQIKGLNSKPKKNQLLYQQMYLRNEYLSKNPPYYNTLFEGDLAVDERDNIPDKNNQGLHLKTENSSESYILSLEIEKFDSINSPVCRKSVEKEEISITHYSEESNFSDETPSDIETAEVESKITTTLYNEYTGELKPMTPLIPRDEHTSGNLDNPEFKSGHKGNGQYYIDKTIPGDPIACKYVEDEENIEISFEPMANTNLEMRNTSLTSLPFDLGLSSPQAQLCLDASEGNSLLNDLEVSSSEDESEEESYTRPRLINGFGEPFIVPHPHNKNNSTILTKDNVASSNIAKVENALKFIKEDEQYKNTLENEHTCTTNEVEKVASHKTVDQANLDRDLGGSIFSSRKSKDPKKLKAKYEKIEKQELQNTKNERKNKGKLKNMKKTDKKSSCLKERILPLKPKNQVEDYSICSERKIEVSTSSKDKGFSEDQEKNNEVNKHKQKQTKPISKIKQTKYDETAKKVNLDSLKNRRENHKQGPIKITVSYPKLLIPSTSRTLKANKDIFLKNCQDDSGNKFPSSATVQKENVAYQPSSIRKKLTSEVENIIPIKRDSKKPSKRDISMKNTTNQLKCTLPLPEASAKIVVNPVVDSILKDMGEFPPPKTLVIKEPESQKYVARPYWCNPSSFPVSHHPINSIDTKGMKFTNNASNNIIQHPSPDCISLNKTSTARKSVLDNTLKRSISLNTDGCLKKRKENPDCVLINKSSAGEKIVPDKTLKRSTSLNTDDCLKKKKEEAPSPTPKETMSSLKRSANKYLKPNKTAQSKNRLMKKDEKPKNDFKGNHNCELPSMPSIDFESCSDDSVETHNNIANTKISLTGMSIDTVTEIHPTTLIKNIKAPILKVSIPISIFASLITEFKENSSPCNKSKTRKDVNDHCSDDNIKVSKDEKQLCIDDKGQNKEKQIQLKTCRNKHDKLNFCLKRPLSEPESECPSKKTKIIESNLGINNQYKKLSNPKAQLTQNNSVEQLLPILTESDERRENTNTIEQSKRNIPQSLSLDKRINSHSPEINCCNQDLTKSETSSDVCISNIAPSTLRVKHPSLLQTNINPDVTSQQYPRRRISVVSPETLSSGVQSNDKLNKRLTWYVEPENITNTPPSNQDPEGCKSKETPICCNLSEPNIKTEIINLFQLSIKTAKKEYEQIHDVIRCIELDYKQKQDVIESVKKLKSSEMVRQEINRATKDYKSKLAGREAFFRKQCHDLLDHFKGAYDLIYLAIYVFLSQKIDCICSEKDLRDYLMGQLKSWIKDCNKYSFNESDNVFNNDCEVVLTILMEVEDFPLLVSGVTSKISRTEQQHENNAQENNITGITNTDTEAVDPMELGLPLSNIPVNDLPQPNTSSLTSSQVPSQNLSLELDLNFQSVEFCNRSNVLIPAVEQSANTNSLNGLESHDLSLDRQLASSNLEIHEDGEIHENPYADHIISPEIITVDMVANVPTNALAISNEKGVIMSYQECTQKGAFPQRRASKTSPPIIDITDEEPQVLVQPVPQPQISSNRDTSEHKQNSGSENVCNNSSSQGAQINKLQKIQPEIPITNFAVQNSPSQTNKSMDKYHTMRQVIQVPSFMVESQTIQPSTSQLVNSSVSYAHNAGQYNYSEQPSIGLMNQLVNSVQPRTQNQPPSIQPLSQNVRKQVIQMSHDPKNRLNQNTGVSIGAQKSQTQSHYQGYPITSQSTGQTLQSSGYINSVQSSQHSIPQYSIGDFHRASYGNYNTTQAINVYPNGVSNRNVPSHSNDNNSSQQKAHIPGNTQIQPNHETFWQHQPQFRPQDLFHSSTASSQPVAPLRPLMPYPPAHITNGGINPQISSKPHNQIGSNFTINTQSAIDWSQSPLQVMQSNVNNGPSQQVINRRQSNVDISTHPNTLNRQPLYRSSSYADSSRSQQNYQQNTSIRRSSTESTRGSQHTFTPYTPANSSNNLLSPPVLSAENAPQSFPSHLQVTDVHFNGPIVTSVANRVSANDQNRGRPNEILEQPDLDNSITEADLISLFNMVDNKKIEEIMQNMGKIDNMADRQKINFTTNNVPTCTKTIINHDGTKQSALFNIENNLNIIAQLPDAELNFNGINITKGQLWKFVNVCREQVSFAGLREDGETTFIGRYSVDGRTFTEKETMSLMKGVITMNANKITTIGENTPTTLLIQTLKATAFKDFASYLRIVNILKRLADNHDQDAQIAVQEVGDILRMLRQT